MTSHGIVTEDVRDTFAEAARARILSRLPREVDDAFYAPIIRRLRAKVEAGGADNRTWLRLLACYAEVERLASEAAQSEQRYTYFIGGDAGAVKIGSASSPVERLASLQCGSPIPLRILAVAAGGYAVEREYHRRFESARSHGEWFQRTPEIEAEIARLASLQGEAA